MTDTTTAPQTEVSRPAPSRWFRGDVDGLRAMAILLVVAYHCGIGLFGGGFIGVDIFFVISGYLISRNLLRESNTTGRVALGRFWARRVRRLVPAMALMVAVTLVAGYFILPLFDLADFAKQGGAASLYVSNILFVQQSTNYFNADVTDSPFLHTWSLGVEEQFYLVWPVLFALVCGVVVAWDRRRSHRRRSHRRSPDDHDPDRRRLLIAIFGVCLAGSLALSVMLTDRGSTWAFFSLPSRAWEFAAAGLLAVIRIPGWFRGVVVRTAAAVAGLALIAVAMALIDDTTAYPGLWALLPVGGTVLLIVAGETWSGEAQANPISRLFSIAPLQWLGRVSYSWYLWHWPFIVLSVVALGRDKVAIRAVAALVALAVAWAAYRYFETPIRFAPVVARSNARTFLGGAVVTALVVVLAVVVWPGATAAPSASTVEVADLEAPPGSSLEERVNFAVQLYRDRKPCPIDSVKTEEGDDYCIGGDTTSDRTLLLLGDSHAGQWRRTLEAITRDRGIKLLVREHNGCPAYEVLTKGKGDERVSKVCQLAHASDHRIIDSLQPDAVLISGWSGYEPGIVDADGNAPSPEDKEAIWYTGVSSLLHRLRDRGIATGEILDEPTLPLEMKTCLVDKGDVDKCAVPLPEAMVVSERLLRAERRAIDEIGGIAILDMAAVVCDDTRCPAEIGDTLTYIDRHHLTDAFTVEQRSKLEALVDQLLP